MDILKSSITALAIAVATTFAGHANAAQANVAVAANFTDAAKEIAAAFAGATEHKVVLSFGATGQIYTQIVQGAPFDVFLAADDIRPAQAVEEGYGVDGTVFTYAIGQLVLYSADEERVKGAETLAGGDFQRIAIANPETAPYGRAAVETMKSLGVYDSLRGKIVQGQNIAQTFQFVATGNAEMGLVALGQVSMEEAGSRWLVPQEHYSPIRQEAVLLKSGTDNPAAVAFVAFLRSEEAIAIIQKFGYAVDR
jgi:molybdate transport system substrate-binding protein